MGVKEKATHNELRGGVGGGKEKEGRELTADRKEFEKKKGSKIDQKKKNFFFCFFVRILSLLGGRE